MNQEQQFIKGFDNGYVLAKHEPELVKKLLLTKNDNNEYYNGIVEGKKQHDIEKVRTRLKSTPNNKIPTKEMKGLHKGR